MMSNLSGVLQVNLKSYPSLINQILTELIKSGFFNNEEIILKASLNLWEIINDAQWLIPSTDVR